MKKLKVISTNVCGNTRAAATLNFPGRECTRIFNLAYRLVTNEQPDILALQEVPFSSLGLIESSIQQYNYKMYIHKDFYAERKKGSFTSLSVLFLKRDLKFEQTYRDGFETQYRYVSGILTIDGQQFFLKANHVPCVCDESGRGRGSGSSLEKHTKYMIKRKRQFLIDEAEYQKSLNEKYAISLGDYNCDSVGDFYGKDLFRELPFIDLVKEPTWNGTALDHLFISNALEKSGKKITHRLLSYPTLTDHKVLELVIG